MSKLDRAMFLRKRREEDSKSKLDFKSKEKILEFLSKRFKTTFIGNIYIFERYFGNLWGHGKAFNKLTDEEKRFKALWTEVRQLILDNGNNQLNLSIDEIMRYKVRYTGYQLDLEVENNKENG